MYILGLFACEFDNVGQERRSSKLKEKARSIVNFSDLLIFYETKPSAEKGKKDLSFRLDFERAITPILDLSLIVIIFRLFCSVLCFSKKHKNAIRQYAIISQFDIDPKRKPRRRQSCLRFFILRPYMRARTIFSAVFPPERGHSCGF